MNQINKVYVINLEKRTERKERMLSILNDLNLSFEFFKAIDGDQIKFDEWNIQVFPGYQPDNKKKTLTKGEIGCFMSHYSIWKEVIYFFYWIILSLYVFIKLKIVEKNLRKVLIFEDDAVIDHDFKVIVNDYMNAFKEKNVLFDFLYVIYI